MAAQTIPALREVAKLLKSGKLTEDEFIRALAAFSRDRDNGKCVGWSLSGFVAHIDRWLVLAKGGNNVYLVCDRCSRKRIVKEAAIRDNASCSCGGRNVRDDQAGAKRQAAHRVPGYKELPTLQELEAAADRALSSGNEALGRIILSQMEKGAFRNAPISSTAPTAKPQPQGACA